MPFTVVVVAGAVLVAYLRGGRLQRIADADLRGVWLLFVGLVLQIVVDIASAREAVSETVGYLGLLASQLLVVGWALWNWWRPGMPLIVIGLFLNALVIGANGAMPVDLDAVAELGGEGVPMGKHEALDESTRLGFLGDVIPLPPLRTIISIGDIVLAAGLVALVHHLMTFRPAPERRGGVRGTGHVRTDDAPDQTFTARPGGRGRG